MPKIKSPPNLDKYVEERNHKYMRYEQAARLFGMPYWSFVSEAKAAKATWCLRKTAIVDIAAFEKYVEENCAVKDDEEVVYKLEENIMPRVRKEVENLEELVKAKKKKYVRYSEGAELYSLGLHTFQQLAKDAGAVRKVKRCTLVNLEKIDAFIESFCEEDF